MTVHSVPKPAPKPRAKRAYNSTFAEKKEWGKAVARTRSDAPPKPSSSLPPQTGRTGTRGSGEVASRKQIARRKGVKKSNPRRRKSEFARAYGSKARVAWVKQQKCVALHITCEGEIHGHHIKTGGAGRKSDSRFVVPLCEYHHRVVHIMGRESFEWRYCIDLETAAAETERRWQAYSQRGECE